MTSRTPHTASADEDFLGVHTYDGVPWSRPLLENPSLLGRLSEQVARRGSAPAITTLGPSATAQTCTYGELWWRVGDGRRELEQAGIGPGDVCGVRVSNTLSSAVEILAVIATGAAALLIDAQEPGSRSDEMVDGAATVDVRPPGVRRRIREPRTYEGGLSPTVAHRPMIYMFTTGSTAASKAVVQADYSVTLNALAVARHHGLSEADTLACPLSISHVNGLEFGLLASLLRGAHCLLFEEFDPFHFMRGMHEHGATLATTVPSLLRRHGGAEQFLLDLDTLQPIPRRDLLDGDLDQGVQIMPGLDVVGQVSLGLLRQGDLQPHAGTDRAQLLVQIHPTCPARGIPVEHDDHIGSGQLGHQLLGEGLASSRVGRGHHSQGLGRLCVLLPLHHPHRDPAGHSGPNLRGPVQHRHEPLDLMLDVLSIADRVPLSEGLVTLPLQGALLADDLLDQDPLDRHVGVCTHLNPFVGMLGGAAARDDQFGQAAPLTAAPSCQPVLCRLAGPSLLGQRLVVQVSQGQPHRGHQVRGVSLAPEAVQERRSADGAATPRHIQRRGPLVVNWAQRLERVTARIAGHQPLRSQDVSHPVQ